MSNNFDPKLVPEALARRCEIAAKLVRDGKPQAALASLDDAMQNGNSVDAFNKACENAGLDPAEEIVRVYRTVGARDNPKAAEERTGLPCEDCGKRQHRVDISRLPDDSLVIRLSAKFAPNEVVKGIKDIIKLLKTFLPH